MLFVTLLSKTEDVDFNYSRTAYYMILKLGMDTICTLWKPLLKFGLGKFKDALVTSHQILEIVPQASHISSHPLELIYTEVFTSLEIKSIMKCKVTISRPWIILYTLLQWLMTMITSMVKYDKM